MNQRIIIVASYLDSISKFRGSLVGQLKARGYEVHVAAPVGVGDDVASVESLGVELHPIPLGRTSLDIRADLATLVALFRLFRRVRPQALLAYTAKPVIYGLLAARVVGVRRRAAIITGLGYAFGGERKWLFLLVKRLYAVALRFADPVFFQNPDDKKLFLELGILRSTDKVKVISGSGVDTEFFSPAKFPPGLSFVMIARLLKDKGVREYVEAARQVRRVCPEARFFLVGWIDSNPSAIRPEELEAWIAAGDIEFLGKMVDVRPAIADATVYVLPSYREGTPRTVLEAMAMGRPVITTDAPGCRETVADGENGFLVPVGAVGELAEAMLRFASNPALASDMGRKSRYIAELKYDVRKVNAAIIAAMKLTGSVEEVNV